MICAVVSVCTRRVRRNEFTCACLGYGPGRRLRRLLMESTADYVCAQRGSKRSHEHARIPWALGAPVGPTQRMDSHGAHPSMDPHGARGTRGSLGPHPPPCAPWVIHGSRCKLMKSNEKTVKLNDTHYDDTTAEVSPEPISSQLILALAWSALGADLGSFGMHSHGKPKRSPSQRTAWPKSAPTWADLEHVGH